MVSGCETGRLDFIFTVERTSRERRGCEVWIGRFDNVYESEAASRRRNDREVLFDGSDKVSGRFKTSSKTMSCSGEFF
jgi:hypothetical protein